MTCCGALCRALVMVRPLSLGAVRVTATGALTRPGEKALAAVCGNECQNPLIGLSEASATNRCGRLELSFERS